MKIVLIRHSNTKVEPDKYNPLWVLSDKGVENAIKLADHPLVQGIEVMYTSNQLKALHTGIIVASKLGVFVRLEEDLTELTSLTNDWKEDYEKFVNDIYTGKIERHAGGESLQEASDRFNQAVEKIVSEESAKKVVGVVAHGNVLSLFASQYEPVSALDIHHVIQMPDVAVFDWESKKFDVIFGNYEHSN